MPLYSFTTEAGDLTLTRHYERRSVPSKINVGGRVYWLKVEPILSPAMLDVIAKQRGVESDYRYSAMGRFCKGKTDALP